MNLNVSHQKNIQILQHFDCKSSKYVVIHCLCQGFSTKTIKNKRKLTLFVNVLSVLFSFAIGRSRSVYLGSCEMLTCTYLDLDQRRHSGLPTNHCNKLQRPL